MEVEDLCTSSVIVDGDLGFEHRRRRKNIRRMRRVRGMKALVAPLAIATMGVL